MKDLAEQSVDAGIWLSDALQVLALRLKHEVAIQRALRGEDRQDGFLGLFVSETEAETLLDELSGRLHVEGTYATAGQIAGAWQDLLPARDASLWGAYARAFELSDLELELLVLAAAPAIDPRFGRVYGFLNDDMSKRYLTPALVQRLVFCVQADSLSLRRCLKESAPLRRYHLINLDAQNPFIESVIRFNEGFLDDLIDPQAAPESGVLIPPLTAIARPCDLPCLVADHGPDPALGFLPALAAQKKPLLVLRGAEFQNAQTLIKRLRRGRLDQHHICLHGFSDENHPLGKLCESLIGHHICATKSRLSAWRIDESAVVADAADRSKALEALQQHFGAASIDLTSMTRSGLFEIAFALQKNQTPPQIIAHLNADCVRQMGHLATPVTNRFTIKDLVVRKQTQTALEQMISWHQQSGRILETWDLGTTFGRTGSGTALFKGPPGTGKTMAAGIIGNTLQMPVFRVNLAAIVSKYIGETQKNLDVIFNAAEDAEVILLFDEADALFGKRSEVSDARDRYANIETSFLLQRLETFAGLSILATNLHQNIDEAFARRINWVIDFPAPGPAERLVLWNRLKNGSAPVAGGVDFAELAHTFELTGGEIRNCALEAAHRAAAMGSEITMTHLYAAIANDLRKQGKPVRKSVFGARYADLKGER